MTFAESARNLCQNVTPLCRRSSEELF